MTKKKVELIRINVSTIPKKDLQYATVPSVLESLHALEAKYKLPLRQFFRTYRNTELNHFTVIRDNPYLYVHSSKRGDIVDVCITEKEKEVTFKLNMEKLEKLLRQ